MKDRTEFFEDNPKMVEELIAFSESNADSIPTLSEYLNRLMAQKNLSAPEIYSRGEINRQVYDRLIQYGEPSRARKLTLLQIAIGILASQSETEQLLATCGYTIEYSSVQDLAFMFCILNGFYDMRCVYEAQEIIAGRGTKGFKGVGK